MTTTPGVLSLVADPALRDEVDRIAAAVGTRVVHLDPATPVTGRIWSAALAVILGGRVTAGGDGGVLARRSDVFLVSSGDVPGARPDAESLTTAIDLGVQQVFVLPGDSDDLVRALARAYEGPGEGRPRGRVVAVIGGRGGAGASVFATAIALSAKGSLLLDLDPRSGGIDLLVGSEAVGGPRWPDVIVGAGRLGWADVRAALPQHRGISVLSGSRDGHEISGSAIAAIVDAARSGGATVVCDLPRHLSTPTHVALEAADLVVVVGSCDVRCCASSAALASALTTVNPNAGLVVRGPSPGGLSAREFAEIVGLPLIASMRPEPMLAEKLERGGLRLGARSPLGGAVRQVSSVLGRGPVVVSDRAA